MTDLQTLVLRGAYSTIRAEHEDAKKRLAKVCGHLMAVPSQILREMQPDNDAVPDSISDLVAAGRSYLQMIEECGAEIESLAKQRAELKKQAWQ